MHPTQNLHGGAYSAHCLLLFMPAARQQTVDTLIKLIQVHRHLGSLFKITINSCFEWEGETKVNRHILKLAV